MAMFLAIVNLLNILAPIIGPILEKLVNQEQTRGGVAPMSETEVKEELFQALKENLGK